MLHALKPEEEQLGIASEGFGSCDGINANAATDTRKSFRLGNHDQSGIVSAGRRVMFKPLVGIFNRDKLLPFAIVRFKSNTTWSIMVQMLFLLIWKLLVKDTANWDISDIQCKCDLLTLDSNLDNEYASHLLSGKSLPISFSAWNQTNLSTGGEKNFS